MEVRTTARKVKVTRGVREHLRDRLDKFSRYLPELDGDGHRAEVKLSAEKHLYHAEILLHVRHRDRVAQGQAEDLIAAIDGAAERLERQLRRLKDRTKRAPARRANGRVPRSAALVALDPSRAGKRRAAAASARSRARDEAEETEAGETRPRIVRTPMPEGKPLSVDEAAEELLAGKREFVVFRDSRSERPCVLYRRKDGRLGLIEAGR